MHHVGTRRAARLVVQQAHGERLRCATLCQPGQDGNIVWWPWLAIQPAAYGPRHVFAFVQVRLWRGGIRGSDWRPRSLPNGRGAFAERSLRLCS